MLQSFTAVSRGFRDGTASPIEFLRSCLERIKQREHEIRAFEFLRIDGLETQAAASERRWRAGEELSSIDGMPIGVKDIIETRDMPTQCGSPYFAGHYSGRDAASVQALRDAGALIVGKTVTTEFAGPFASKTRNPWSLSHTPGGSSSGSAAAVAAGMLPAALGTQVIGSIIRPASYCGVHAIKPSVGAINRGGSHDGLSQSAHGVLAADLTDGWNVLREIASRVGGDPGHPPLAEHGEELRAFRPRRIGVIRTRGYEAAESYAREALMDLAMQLSTADVRVTWPDEHSALAEIEDAILDSQRLSLEIVGYESIWPLKSYLVEDESKLSRLLRERVCASEQMSPKHYSGLLRQRDTARRRYAAAAAPFDALITLSATGTAPLGLNSTGDTVFNTPASYLGIPAVSLPLFSHQGMPFGLQVLGRQGADYRTVAAAAGLLGLAQDKLSRSSSIPTDLA